MDALLVLLLTPAAPELTPRAPCGYGLPSSCLKQPTLARAGGTVGSVNLVRI
jgi:hypothetical protein